MMQQNNIARVASVFVRSVASAGDGDERVQGDFGGGEARNREAAAAKLERCNTPGSGFYSGSSTGSTAPTPAVLPPTSISRGGVLTRT